MEIIIGLIESRPIRVISSAITLTEVLFYPIQLGRTDLENAYRDILSNTGVFQLWPVTTSIAERAARLRVEHNLRTPDALHLATAVLTGCEAFLTNDQRLKRVGDINVLTLDDLSTDEV
jgi:predicted nucleic acid-binding protein